MKQIMLFFALCLYAFPIYARISQTEAEVFKFLGKGQQFAKPQGVISPRGTKEWYYFKDPFEIAVFFYRGSSQLEKYRKIGGNWSPSEIAAILGNNSLGGRWIADHDERDKGFLEPMYIKHWHLENAALKLKAYLIPNIEHAGRDQFLIIETEIWSNAVSQEQGKHNPSEF